MQQGLNIRFQPVYSPKENKVYGYEGFLYIADEIYGNVSPRHFLPTAKMHPAFIRRLDDWVLNKTAEEAGVSPQSLRFSCNISAATFQTDNLIDKINDLSVKYGMPDRRPIVEIGPEVFKLNAAAAEEAILTLREDRVEVYIDDFDPKYMSSMLTADGIKIPPRYISKITDYGAEFRVVKELISFGRLNDMNVVAVGVENAEQEELLLKMGCERMQGYYYSSVMHDMYTEEMYYDPDMQFYDKSLTKDEAMDVMLNALIATATTEVVEIKPLRVNVEVSRGSVYEIPSRYIKKVK